MVKRWLWVAGTGNGGREVDKRPVAKVVCWLRDAVWFLHGMVIEQC